MDTPDEILLRQAIALAKQAHQAGERPFGAVLVFNDQVVAQAQDQCRALNALTAHAELQLISSYCHSCGHFDLTVATIYTCAEPCVMCSGAIKWAGISWVVLASHRRSYKRSAEDVASRLAMSWSTPADGTLRITDPYW